MEIILKKEQLVPTLNTVLDVVDNKTAHAIYSNVLISVLDNEIEFTGTDAESQVTIQHTNHEGTTYPDIPAGATVKIGGDKVDRIIDRKKVALFMDQFDIDMTLCLFCGLCTEVCPTECLTMKDSLEGIEYSEFDRGNLIYKFADPALYK